jgi:hypothetical protein
MTDLIEAKRAKLEEINLAAEEAKQNGIQSRALGIHHTYSADDADMAQLNSFVIASMLQQLQGQTTFPILAQDQNGIWAYRPHNIPQVQQVASDVYKGIIAILNKKQSLIDQLKAANSPEAIQETKS